jgi:hypothetical protein
LLLLVVVVGCCCWLLLVVVVVVVFIPFLRLKIVEDAKLKGLDRIQPAIEEANDLLFKAPQREKYETFSLFFSFEIVLACVVRLHCFMKRY